jgi:hypothetical protein
MRLIGVKQTMKTHHVILTAEEFEELKSMKMVPIDDLPIDQDEKDALKEQVAKKFGGGGVTQPMEDPIPRVVCGMVDDSVVCARVPRSEK